MQHSEQSLKRITRLDSPILSPAEKYKYVLNGRLSALPNSAESGNGGENQSGSFIPIKRTICHGSVKETAYTQPTPGNKLISLVIPTRPKRTADAVTNRWSADEDTASDDSVSIHLNKFDILSKHSTCKFMQWVSQRSLKKRSATQQDYSKLSCKDLNLVKECEEKSISVIDGLGKADFISVVEPKEDNSEPDIKDEQSDLSVKWIKLKSDRGLQTKFMSYYFLNEINKSQAISKQSHIMPTGFTAKAPGY